MSQPYQERVITPSRGLTAEYSAEGDYSPGSSSTMFVGDLNQLQYGNSFYDSSLQDFIHYPSDAPSTYQYTLGAPPYGVRSGFHGEPPRQQQQHQQHHQHQQQQQQFAMTWSSEDQVYGMQYGAHQPALNSPMFWKSEQAQFSSNSGCMTLPGPVQSSSFDAPVYCHRSSAGAGATGAGGAGGAAAAAAAAPPPAPPLHLSDDAEPQEQTDYTYSYPSTIDKLYTFPADWQMSLTSLPHSASAPAQLSAQVRAPSSSTSQSNENFGQQRGEEGGIVSRRSAKRAGKTLSITVPPADLPITDQSLAYHSNASPKRSANTIPSVLLPARSPYPTMSTAGSSPTSPFPASEWTSKMPAMLSKSIRASNNVTGLGLAEFPPTPPSSCTSPVTAYPAILSQGFSSDGTSSLSPTLSSNFKRSYSYSSGTISTSPMTSAFSAASISPYSSDLSLPLPLRRPHPSNYPCCTEKVHLMSPPITPRTEHVARFSAVPFESNAVLPASTSSKFGPIPRLSRAVSSPILTSGAFPPHSPTKMTAIGTTSNPTTPRRRKASNSLAPITTTLTINIPVTPSTSSSPGFSRSASRPLSKSSSRSPSKTNIISDSVGGSGSGQGNTEASPIGAGAGEVTAATGSTQLKFKFINFGAQHADKLLSGVAPSGQGPASGNHANAGAGGRRKKKEIPPPTTSNVKNSKNVISGQLGADFGPKRKNPLEGQVDDYEIDDGEPDSVSRILAYHNVN